MCAAYVQLGYRSRLGLPRNDRCRREIALTIREHLECLLSTRLRANWLRYCPAGQRADLHFSSIIACYSSSRIRKKGLA